MARWSTTTVIRLATAALIACTVQAGLAQRGGGHGGFAAHGASMTSHAPSGFRGGFGGDFRAAPRPSFAPSRSGMTARGFAPQRRFMPAGRMENGRVPYRSGFNSRSPQYRPDRYRRPYRGGYRRPYINTAWNIWPGWTVPYYLGYPDDYGYDYDQTPQAQPDQGDAYAEGPYANDPEPWSAYPPEQSAVQHSSPVPAPQESVTLIFKDGRQPEQVSNYMMTGKTLYVLDQKRREIPLKDLDLAATARANQDAGVDFHLPTGTP